GAPPSPIDDPVTPINSPDYFAWQLFAYVNAPAPVQTKVNVGGKIVMTNSALWETWASDDHTFGRKTDPPPDPKKPPTWAKPGQALGLGFLGLVSGQLGAPADAAGKSGAGAVGRREPQVGQPPAAAGSKGGKARKRPGADDGADDDPNNRVGE